MLGWRSGHLRADAHAEAKAVIEPSQRPTFFGVRLADPMPTSDTLNSTGVAEEQPPSASQSTAQAGGGGVLFALLACVAAVAFLAWLARRSPEVGE